MWSIQNLWAVLAALAVATVFAKSGSQAQKYRIIVEALDMKKPSGDPYVTMNYIRCAKYNRTEYVINANGIVHKDIPLDAMLDVTAFEKQNNNRYSMIPVKLLKGNFCAWLKSDILFYEDVLKVSNLPKTCPFKADNYTATNFVVTSDKLPNELPGERWRIDLKLTTGQGKEIWTCSCFIFINRYF